MQFKDEKFKELGELLALKIELSVTKSKLSLAEKKINRLLAREKLLKEQNVRLLEDRKRLIREKTGGN